MKTGLLISRVLAFLPGSKSKSIGKALQSFSSKGMAASRLNSDSRQQSLEDLVIEHLSAYSDLNVLLEHRTPIDQLPESSRLAQEAANLTQRISSIPGYEEIEPLAEAHSALVRHWQSSWGNGGISTTAYRSRLKALILYTRFQCDSKARCSLS